MNLDGKVSERVLEFIRTQSMPKEVFGYHDSTLEKFQEYVEAYPDDFSNRAIELFDMGKYSYIDRLFNGIANVSKNKKINWHILLSLSEKLIILEKKDHTYRGIMMSMMKMFGQAMDHNSISFGNKENIWHVLKSSCILLQNFERFDVDDDFHTAAINSVFGTIFNSIIFYTSWHNKHTPKKLCLPPEVKQLFADYMDKKINNSIYGHAILGSQIPFLYQLDKTFSNNIISFLFNNSNHKLSTAAWTSYTMNIIYADFFKILYEHYDKFTKQLKNLELDNDNQLKRSDKSLIQHILLAYLYKFPNSRTIFENIINIKNNNIFEYCSGFVAKKLKHDKEKPSDDFDLDAMRNIWKTPELFKQSDIVLWLEYTPFNKDDTIKIFLEQLKIHKGHLNRPYGIIKILSTYVDTHSKQVIQCLKLMIKDRIDGGIIMYIDSPELYNILKLLLQIDVCKNDTEKLIITLAELDYNEYLELLNDI